MVEKEKTMLEQLMETLEKAAPVMTDVNCARMIGYGEAIIDLQGSNPNKKDDKKTVVVA
jgi:hypothetical protein